MTKATENIALIACWDFKTFPKAPNIADPTISPCKLVRCPVCTKKMWLSRKKDECMSICNDLGKRIIYRCYPCMSKWMMEHKSDFANADELNFLDITALHI
jgi:hypothetical protein